MTLAVMGCVVNGPGEQNTPTSASRCPAPAKPAGAGVRRTAKGRHPARRQHRRRVQARSSTTTSPPAREEGRLRRKTNNDRRAEHCNRKNHMTRPCRPCADERHPAADARNLGMIRTSSATGCRLRLPPIRMPIVSRRRCSNAPSARSPTSSKDDVLPSPTRSTASTSRCARGTGLLRARRDPTQPAPAGGPQRLWYAARCSATSAAEGRYRQFHQVGVEAISFAGRISTPS